MQLTDRGCLAGSGRLVGEQLAGLAPVDDLRRAPPRRQPAAAERDRRQLPAVGLGRRCDAGVGHLAAPQALLKQLADDELLAGAQLELTQVDAASPQAHPVDLDLRDAPDADKHPAALHGHHEPVHLRRRAAA
jgi:hypothetical protein